VSGIVAALSLITILAAGMWLAAASDRLAAGLLSGRGVRGAALGPLRELAATIRRQDLRTEAPDAMLRHLAPWLYLALALAGLAVIPVGPDAALIGMETTVVLWGTVESLTVVAVFLHGWAPNSALPLIGAYRYVAIGLPAMLLSMFVLIAAALPARSLDLRLVVLAQEGAWNLWRQPLGLPLFLLLGLSLTLRGPFDYADGADLAGGTSAEDSSVGRALWQGGRLAMLVSFSAMAATAFLGGWLGPALGPAWLAGPIWLGLKTAAVLLVMVALTHLLARTTAPRMLGLVWKVLLPLSFVALVQAGAVALWT
jgi:NADH-quinone oxidoreductase subunit H